MLANPEYQLCTRCGDKTYRVDRVGPLKGCFFHTQCLKCAVCGTKLTLRTYIHNQHDPEDKAVYCNNHVPRVLAGRFDGGAVGIQAALNAPKASESHKLYQGERAYYDTDAVAIRAALAAPKPWYKHGENNQAHFDSHALHIQHPMQQNAQVSRPPKLRVGQIQDAPMLPVDIDTQVEMEMKHRDEEDKLFRIFQKEREDKKSVIHQEIEQEWQKELKRLKRSFDDEVRRKGLSADEQKRATLRLQKEKKDLEQFMTLKRDRAQREILRKMMEQERQQTTYMIEKHANEMLELINKKKAEIQAQQLELSRMQNMSINESGYHSYNQRLSNDRSRDNMQMNYPLSRPPPPRPPEGSKSELYNDPAVFEELDEQAISVAQEDQSTFTELVRQLIRNCVTDVEKARAIFRWLTVKNLNAMQFDDRDVDADTPMGLLRGIKYGTESYHVLFKRLCSYAGLHCVVIRGYSKSAGYLPGMKFEDKKFRNTWNAVFLDGSWRFVQCNWGARHLVNAKDAPKPAERTNAENLRYEYDDHYFLTDPDQFIYEFFPKQKEWQLLQRPISLAEFEELPFVRSLFFKYGLKFAEQNQPAVMHTDKIGAVTLKILMPPYFVSSLVFHYNLHFVDSDQEEHNGINMRRYVMQTVVGNSVVFKAHAPVVGEYILDIFANLVSTGDYMTGQPMRFKSVCKMKIVCQYLERCMVPLPNCASGEWGPLKAYKLFGLIPMNHEEAVINTSSDSTEIHFRMSHYLSNFMMTLHQNGTDPKQLSRNVKKVITDDKVIFKVAFPSDGQYGLDIYTRDTTENDAPKEKNMLTHCCKYLINVRKR